VSAARFACVLVLLAAVAEAGPRRKQAPTKLEKAAGRAFDQALEAENRGDLEDAATLYEKSLVLAAHPFTVFNLAEVRAAQGHAFDAIVLYETYLALEPTTRDRAVVEAVVKELWKKPTTLEIAWGRRPTMDPSTAYVIVDGKIVSKPGSLKSAATLRIPVAAGVHSIDVVSDVSYYGDVVTIGHGKTFQITVNAPTRVDGNVVVRASEHLKIYVDKLVMFGGGVRQAASPGPQRVRVGDRNFECPPATLQIAKGDTITYLHVAGEELTRSRETQFHCRALTFTRHELAF